MNEAGWKFRGIQGRDTVRKVFEYGADWVQ